MQQRPKNVNRVGESLYNFKRLGGMCCVIFAKFVYMLFLKSLLITTPPCKALTRLIMRCANFCARFNNFFYGFNININYLMVCPWFCIARLLRVKPYTRGRFFKALHVTKGQTWAKFERTIERVPNSAPDDYHQRHQYLGLSCMWNSIIY
jgi:hypothetical protein